MDNKQSAEIGMAAGFGLAVAALAWPNYLSGLPEGSRQVVGCIGLGTFAISLVALIKPNWFWRKAASVTPSNLHPELSLTFGHDGHYVETNSYNSVNIRKTACVGVKNAGNALLSNCKLMFEARRTDGKPPEAWLRDGPFSLSVGEVRYLSVAAYNEPVSPETIPEQWIQLSAPPSGTHWRAPMLPSSGGAVTLLATSAESRECQTICRFWANNGKFHWEEVTGNPIPGLPRTVSATDTIDELVPMREAITKAYETLRASGSAWAKTADMFAGSKLGNTYVEGVLLYFANAFVTNEVAIYGKHPPSRIPELIDPAEFKRGRFADNGATFLYHGEKDPKYVDLAVRSAHLERVIEKMTRDSSKAI
jgi:hypothetical protein